MKDVTPSRTKHGAMICLMAFCLALTPAMTSQAKSVTDADITGAVNAELWADNAVLANNIDVATEDGIVTLKGTVNNLLAKERAAALCEAIVGVRAIVNTIEVKPTTARGDSKLKEAVERAWLNDAAADSYELTASADKGVVTLRGNVQSYAEKEVAATVAKGVRGVKAIQNEIEIDYKDERSDFEIESEIRARLENDIRIDDFLVKVDVDNGDVELSGTVGSLQEKTRAGTDAWVAGVKSVDTDDLDIEWWARDDMRRKNLSVSRTDEEIRKAVLEALLRDPRVFSYNPYVKVSDGTVRLSGIVKNLEAKRAAEQDARNTLGVWRVKNHLKVRPDIPDNDVLEDRVAEALNEDPYTERFEIEIDAYDGWVYLSGQVDTSFEKSRAEGVAEGVQGIIGVVNNLDYKHLWLWKADWEIRADVKDQLEWSVFVDEEDVSVAVDDGIVTLTGTVDSWTERNEAEKNAFQGGAKDVRNYLSVDYRYYGPYGPGHYATHYDGGYYEPYE